MFVILMPSASFSPHASLVNLPLSRISRLLSVPSRRLSGSPAESGRKERIVLLGSGWGGYQFLKHLKRSAYDLVCVSPRNHFVFTPLLPSATVGAVEYDSITEAVRDFSDTTYLQAECTEIDAVNKTVLCHDTTNNVKTSIAFDHLIISTGAKCNTFRVPGVEQNALYVKTVEDSKKLRSRILDCFEKAAASVLEKRAPSEYEHLTRFVVVGAGATSVEFVGELTDFIQKDASRMYPGVKSEVVLVEVLPSILSMYVPKHIKYAVDFLNNRRVQMITSTSVQEVKPDVVVLKGGRELKCGACVWATGVGSTDFITQLSKKQSWLADHTGRLVVSNKLQVLSRPPQSKAGLTVDFRKDKLGEAVSSSCIYAMGDCAVPASQPTTPPTAQAVTQEAMYLATLFNQRANGAIVKQDFKYSYKGMATSIGGFRALVELKVMGVDYKPQGYFAWLLWRGVYLMQLPSWRSRWMVLNEWGRTYLTGRPTSR